VSTGQTPHTDTPARPTNSTNATNATNQQTNQPTNPSLARSPPQRGRARRPATSTSWTWQGQRGRRAPERRGAR
jgi:hypothetical protein